MLSPSVTRWSTLILAVIATFMALQAGQGVFAPLLLAFVIGVVLSPLSDFCERLGAQRILATVISMAVGVSLIVVIGLLLQPLALRVVELAPVIWARFVEMMDELQALLTRFGAFARLPEAAAPAEGDAGVAIAREAMDLPSITAALLVAPAVAGQILIFLGGLFFFLSSRVEVYDYLSRHRVLSERPRDVTRILLAAERRVSRYFLTILVINAAFGAIVAAAMALIGMPWPITWGIAAFLLNFILYLGPIFMAGCLVVAGLMTFQGLGAFLPVAVYVALNATEGQFVTPSLVGRSLRVNPLLVFLSLVLWLWLWGPIGAFIAIPLLVWVIAVATGFKGEREERTRIDRAIEIHQADLAAARRPGEAPPTAAE
jgi:predicted PurR-regulated permease PerM